MSYKRWIFGLLFVTSVAAAGPRETLLLLDHQPTVTEIMNVFGGKLPDANPFGSPTAEVQANLLTSAPSVIATFEKTFPGATYAPLGRDSAFLGDVIDAFYQRLGQKRVVRVSASGASRTGVEQDVVDFVRGIGFDVAHADKTPPFVMFDQTNFASTSQSISFLTAIYAACEKTPGCDKEKLVERFNFLNTGSARNMYNFNVVDATTAIVPFLNDRKAYAKSPGHALDKILSVTVAQNLVYTTEYHEKFSKFTRNGNLVTTKPGTLSGVNVRVKILADVFAAMKTVATPEFRQKVQAEARLLGYEFPLERLSDPVKIEAIRSKVMTPEEILGVTLVETRKRLAELAQSDLAGDALKLAITNATQNLSRFPIVMHSAIIETLATVAKARPAENMNLGWSIVAALGAYAPGNPAVFTNEGRREFNRLMRNETVRKVFLDEIPRWIHEGNTRWPQYSAYYRGAAMGWSGQSPADFDAGFLRPAFELAETQFKEKLRGPLAGENLRAELEKILQANVPRGHNFEEQLFKLKMVLLGAQSGKFDRLQVATVLVALTQDKVNEPDARAKLTDVIRRSPFAREVFNGQVANMILPPGGLTAVVVGKFRLLSMEVNGQTPAQFATAFAEHLLTSAASREDLASPIAQLKNYLPWFSEMKPTDLYPAFLKAAEKHARKTAREKLDFSQFLETAAQPRDPAQDEELAKALVETVNESPLLKEVMSQAVLARAQASVPLRELYSRWAKLPMDSGDQIQEESRERAFVQGLDEQIAQHRSPGQIAGYVQSTLSQWPNTPARGVRIARAVADLLDRKYLNEEGASHLMTQLVIVDALTMHDPASRAALRALLKKSAAFKRTFLGGVAHTVRHSGFIHRFEYESFVTEWQGVSIESYRKNVLRSLIEDLIAGNHTAQKFAELARNEMNNVGTGSQGTPVDLDLAWESAIDATAEFVRAKRLPADDLAELMWYALHDHLQKPERIETFLKQRLAANATIKAVWGAEMAESYASRWRRANAGIGQSYARISGLSTAELERRIAGAQIDRLLAQSNLSSQQLLNEAYAATRALTSANAAEGFLAHVHALAKLLDAHRLSATDVAQPMNTYVGKEAIAAGTEGLEGFRRVLAESAGLRAVWDGPTRLYALSGDDTLWNYISLLENASGDSREFARTSLRKTLAALGETFALKKVQVVGAVTYENSTAPAVLKRWFDLVVQREDWRSPQQTLVLSRLLFDETLAHQKALGISNHDLSTVLGHMKVRWQDGTEETSAFLTEWMRTDEAAHRFVVAEHLPYLLNHFTAIGGDASLQRKFFKHADLAGEAGKQAFAKVIEALTSADVLPERTRNEKTQTSAGKNTIAAIDGGQRVVGSLGFFEWPRFFEAVERASEAGRLSRGDERDLLVHVFLSAAADSPEMTAFLRALKGNSFFQKLLLREGTPYLSGETKGTTELVARFQTAFGSPELGWGSRTLTSYMIRSQLEKLSQVLEASTNITTLAQELNKFGNAFEQLARQRGADEAVEALVGELGGDLPFSAEGRASVFSEVFLSSSVPFEGKRAAQVAALARERPVIRDVWLHVSENAPVRPNAQSLVPFYRGANELRVQALAGSSRTGTLAEFASLLTEGGAQPLPNGESANGQVLSTVARERIAAVTEPAAVLALQHDYFETITQGLAHRKISEGDAAENLKILLSDVAARSPAYLAQLQERYVGDANFRKLWNDARQRGASTSTGEVVNFKAADISATKRCALAIKRIFK